MSAYEVRRIDELESIAVAGVNWRPIRRALGIRAYGINAYTGNEGEHVVEEHTEGDLGHEEVYVVITGSARFTLGDDEHDVAAGAFVYLRDPNTRRVAVALENGTTVLAVGGKPGEAYEPSAWEWDFAAAPFRDRKDYARGLAIVREGLAAKPDSGVMHYQVACFEALLGDRDGALEHLRRAAELDLRARRWMRTDDDLDSLRGDPEFLAIAGEPEPPGESA
jgi:mannose-6-phosphate isomerase-like protein (cupin superfamily)